MYSERPADCRDLFVRGSGSGTGTVTVSDNGLINCRYINFTGPSGVVNLTSGTINAHLVYISSTAL